MSTPATTRRIPNELYQCVLDLTNSDMREDALYKLSSQREDFPELAPILWHSFGTISALLQEIVSIYPLVSTPKLTPAVSNRCCNALALLQCVASHQDTRSLFLNSHLGLFLYPFLNTRNQERQYEYLRLTSLGVRGALVKMDDNEVISFLLNTEIIPLCLSIMGTGTELSQTVATFIIQKILVDDTGLNYICHTFERFDTVSTVLSKMVKEHPSARLLKHIVRCYLRLSDNQRACDALRHKLPEQLKDNTFAEELKEDQHTSHWLNKLLYQVSAPPDLHHGQGPQTHQHGVGLHNGPPNHHQQPHVQHNLPAHVQHGGLKPQQQHHQHPGQHHHPGQLQNLAQSHAHARSLAHGQHQQHQGHPQHPQHPQHHLQAHHQGHHPQHQRPLYNAQPGHNPF